MLCGLNCPFGESVRCPQFGASLWLQAGFFLKNSFRDPLPNPILARSPVPTNVDMVLVADKEAGVSNEAGLSGQKSCSWAEHAEVAASTIWEGSRPRTRTGQLGWATCGRLLRAPLPGSFPACSMGPASEQRRAPHACSSWVRPGQPEAGSDSGRVTYLT